jgi:predicted ATPase
MIKSLNLDGFKSFVSDTIQFGGLTLLTGLNSSGKSSVIQALLMLENIAHKKEFLLEGHGDLKELKNSYCDYLEVVAYLENGTSVCIPQKVEIAISENIEFPQSIYIAADRLGAELSMPIFIGDNYKLGKKGENIFKCIEKNEFTIISDKLKHPKSKGDTFLYNLEAWLGVISPNIDFKPYIQKLSDSSFATFNGYRAKNVGFGLSYTLPVITALLLGSITPNSLVLIENPEAHLHPRGQTEIGKLIALCAEVGVQVIVETHSDHIFDAARIHAKTSLCNFHELVKVYWFELDKNKNTEIQQITINKNGRLDNCPQGFFDQFEINASKLM